MEMARARHNMCELAFSLLFNEYLGSFPGLKHLGRNVNLSAPSSVEIKNEWSYTSPPLVPFLLFDAFEAVCASRLLF
jgi:hypothetical protein